MNQVITPSLRFEEFQDNWELKNLKDVFELKYGKDHKHLNQGIYPMLGSGGIMRYVDSYLYNQPSVLIGRKGTIDKPLFITTPFWTVDTLFYTIIKQGQEPYFVYSLAQTINWYKYNEATGVPSLNTSGIYSVPVYVPLIKEQQKIASFLTSVDSKISQLTEKHRLLKEYKKGVMQQIFSQQLRFKDEGGKAFPEWEARLFSEFINTKSELPTKSFSGDLCSLTIKNGIEIKPSRYIREHLVKDIASAYKVAQVGDFVINPMNVRFGALGVNHHYKPVLISKYYDVFECDNTVDRMFFEIYLLSQKMLNHYNRVATGTLEEKKRVHFSEFLKFKKELPCLEEQQKIAQFLQSIDKKVDSVAQQVEQTKQFKKGLLQQMFV